MLEIRSHCEHCGKPLSVSSHDAYICTFECTFCKNCVDDILEGVCPNCGGNFVRRPIRPASLVSKYPPAKTPVIKAVDLKLHKIRLEKLKNLNPADR
jgi:hypothetical protein